MRKRNSNQKANHSIQCETELEEFKRFLGPAAEGHNAAQLRQLRQEMYGMAELLLDLHLMKK